MASQSVKANFSYVPVRTISSGGGEDLPSNWTFSCTSLSWIKKSHCLNALGDAKAAGYLIIEEGETDYARLTQAGIPAFGVPGATTWQSKWVDYLQDIQAVYLWQEPGSGGEALFQAIAKDLPQVRIIQAPPEAKDPCEVCT